MINGIGIGGAGSCGGGGKCGGIKQLLKKLLSGGAGGGSCGGSGGCGGGGCGKNVLSAIGGLGF